MTICSLLSSEQTAAIKDQFAGVEITDADFDRIEVIGDLIRHIEIVDTRLVLPVELSPALSDDIASLLRSKGTWIRNLDQSTERSLSKIAHWRQ
jgi:hypothetical protein